MPRLTTEPTSGLPPDQRLRHVLATAEPLGRPKRALVAPEPRMAQPNAQGSLPAGAQDPSNWLTQPGNSQTTFSHELALWDEDETSPEHDQHQEWTTLDGRSAADLYAGLGSRPAATPSAVRSAALRLAKDAAPHRLSSTEQRFEFSLASELSEAEQSSAAASDADDPEPSGLMTRAKQFATKHLAAVGLVLVIVLTFVIFQTTKAHSEAVPIQLEPTPSLTGSPTDRSTKEEAAPTSAKPQIRVHVIGAVLRPGVVNLDLGARVVDAIEAAGGLSSDAELGDLNLAAVVSDGAQIVVGSASKPGSTMRAGGQQTNNEQAQGAQDTNRTTSGSATNVNLNTANQAQLETLPGVGPVTAKAILAWRSEHGKFTRVEELQEVNGIGAKTYAQIAPHVTV